MGSRRRHPERIRWDLESPRILMAQGHTSALLAGVFKQSVVPAFGDGFAARLDVENASFLDIGPGVAALSVAMCRMWPSLRVVAVDPWAPAIALGRARFADVAVHHDPDLRSPVTFVFLGRRQT